MTYQTISAQTDKLVMPTTALRLQRRLGYGWTTLSVSIALALLVLFMTPVRASPLNIGSQRTIPNGNLHLEPGQTIDDDVIVFSGNVTLEEDAQITGDLLVMSGNIEILEGATVNGDVATFSGNIDLYGTIEGDIAAVSGNIDLYDGAKVEGDISVVSGNLTREENTEVDGDTVSGQNFDFGKIFGFADSGIANDIAEEIKIEIEAEMASARTDESASSAGSNQESSREQRRGGGFGAVIAGIFGAFFSALVLAILAGLVAWIRPTIIKSVQKRLRDELALCFGAGLVVNIGGFLIAGVMAITIIGLLVAVPAWIVLFFLNIAGGIVAAAALGERISNYLNFSGNHPVKIAIGAAVIILSISLLWSMGGCFSFIGFLGFFLLSSIGTGALVLPWVRRFMDDSKPAQHSNDDWSPSDEPTMRDNADDETDNEGLADEEDEAMAAEPVDSPIQTEPIAEEPKAKSKKPVADNFTKIRGIGAVFAARLADANVTSYAQLASMSAEEIGEIFGWPVERVERDDIIGQAIELAAD